ncbi:MAG: EVE domain-containing protein [Verrucomicrobia bacterium 21-51-4]|nr:MAG: EVE domain-containing protein [Verrucomicrobia bacterium 21-51-4]HQU08804.1 EVE domain-containing protein [Opitutales bacterium]
MNTSTDKPTTASARYWLMKSEPSTFSIEDLAKSPKQTTAWEGVRNYQARNFMRDAMRVGDVVFFYHSSCAQPAVVGLAKIIRKAYPDSSAQNKDSEYFDPKASPENPRWWHVDIQLVEIFKATITLQQIKADPILKTMLVAKPGQRLSIQPVEDKEAKRLLRLAHG